MHKVIYGIVVSVFALCIISTVPQAVNDTDWPSDFNDTNVSSTEEPFIPFSPTQPFETVSTENLTESSAPYSTTESTITESATTPRGATTTSPQETDTGKTSWADLTGLDMIISNVITDSTVYGKCRKYSLCGVFFCKNGSRGDMLLVVH